MQYWADERCRSVIEHDLRGSAEEGLALMLLAGFVFVFFLASGQEQLQLFHLNKSI